MNDKLCRKSRLGVQFSCVFLTKITGVDGVSIEIKWVSSFVLKLALPVVGLAWRMQYHRVRMSLAALKNDF